MSTKRNLLVMLAISASAFFGLAALAAPSLKNSFCLDCHAEKNLSKTNAAGKEISLFVDKAVLSASVHGTNTCISCHIGVTFKHPDDHKALQPVDCKTCHEKPVKSDRTNAHAIKKD
jgi:hypothetical protein